MDIETLATDVIHDLCEKHRDSVSEKGITLVGHSLGAKVGMNIALRMHGRAHLPGQWFRNWTKGVDKEIGDVENELVKAPEYDNFRFLVNNLVCLESTPLPTVPHPIDNPVSSSLQKMRDIASHSLEMATENQIKAYVTENLNSGQANDLLSHLAYDKQNDKFFYKLPLVEMMNTEDFYNMQSVCSDHAVHDFRGRVLAIYGENSLLNT